MIYYCDFDTGDDLLDEGLEKYLMYGIQPGGFLTSVLANDLYLTLGRADHKNKENLDHIVTEITYKVPSVALGSYQRVKDWCDNKDNRRSEFVARKEKEYTWRVLNNQVRKKPKNVPF